MKIKLRFVEELGRGKSGRKVKVEKRLIGAVYVCACARAEYVDLGQLTLSLFN